MKGGREEDKIMDPMFPRLHVNDTDKRGPRAPPRNKMALYEQLSIPSQRFSSAATSTLPLPRHTTITLVPSASSSQGCDHERSVFSPFYIPPHAPTHSTENVHSRSSDGMNPNASRVEIERKSAKHATQRTMNASGHFQSAAESSSFRPHDLSSMKDSCAKKSEDEDDFRVPTFIESRIAPFSDKDPHVIDGERPTAFHAIGPQKSAAATLSSSIKLPISLEKPMERTSTTDLKSRQHERSNGEKKANDTGTHKEHTDKSISATGERTAEPSDFAKESSKQEQTIGAVNDLEHSRGNTRRCQESSGNGTMGRPRCLTEIEVMDKGDNSGVRSGSCSKRLPGSNLRSLNVAENFNGGSEDKMPGSLELGDANRNDEVSETSIVDSISGLDISPDDVVGVIGAKHFWKARRAIVNQQRIFAVQVFELHRLIKVQKLIAASPHLLLECNPYLSRSLPKIPSKTLASEHIGKSHTQIVKQKDDSQRANNNECPAENTVGGPPHSSHEDDLSNGSAGEVPSNVPFSDKQNQAPVASDHKSSSWCFPQPSNQWLIPVMSPSEGLIYKPYAGSCPPAAGFMVPVYGGCGPLSVPPVMGDFMNPAYGVPASHQQQNIGVLSGASAIASNYFPSPYGLPVMNPLMSTSAVERVSPLAGARPNGQAEQYSRGSCNMSNPKSEALTGCAQKFQTSKDSEFQGSTASSHCERVQGRDALPLFSMASATEGSGQPIQAHGGGRQTHVIKVVPHNPRSATESAARIFRSIQKERQQFDSM